ncbi:uncharacterized protein LOC128245376 isoform X2 [Mya arenaria]|uniref:uncharacterized protein LOC128245376 isoform X2 n=1 Tax=Mya arenaria TaxID=6604 RepID=UPI0022E25150|nr:uncharacterized protein LOC128245376 isoform X2 [Mya arenaria]XP_052819479.1 uncharacterized protein LOC128245376 isoform X2 [Mya arenaria]XP_052819480.1 uncharacterized protein LOC128245376 isoform X2 [Mya arenaria]
MDYKEEKNDLRVRLANSYMESEDFSMEDNPTHFDELYMSPRIVEHHILNRGNTNVHENIDEEINSVKSYKAIFYKGDSLASTVYLVGSSGTGKTIFSRKCVLEWSYHHLKIHDDVQSTPKMNDLFTDRDFFGGIDFLFHIRLRDGNNVCSLTDMIKDQLISRIYDKEDIEKEYKLILKVLDENACLIVAENLHEWAHTPEASCACTHLEKADTPSFTYAKKACIMLTTRHWRFHSIRSAELRANTYFEIEGILDRKGFVKKAILAKNGHETYVDTFFTHFADRKFAKMLSVPFFSMQLVDLYLELDTPKTALCDICSSIVKMRLKKIPTYHQKAPQTDPVHKRRKLSVKHDEVVEALSELAIRTIVSRESSLNREFSQDLVDEMLTVSEKTIALKSGILQQQHLNAKQSVMKVSFCHKSIQDFLAAKFLVNHDDAFETLIKSCKEQNNYLTCIRIKQVLIFTFGLKPRLGEESG